MSKQANEVRKILDILFDDYASEVDISKITSVLLHKGIIVDFYVPDINCVIEVHGEQHESAQSFGGDKVTALTKFNRQLDRDSKLKNICSTFNINYVEIWYYDKIDIGIIYKKLEEFME